VQRAIDGQTADARIENADGQIFCNVVVHRNEG
jgi:hypothetical protein